MQSHEIKTEQKQISNFVFKIGEKWDQIIFQLEKQYTEISVVYYLYEFLNDPGDFIVIKKA